MDCAGAGTGRCPRPLVAGLPVRSPGWGRPLTQARLCSLLAPRASWVWKTVERDDVSSAQDSGAEPARGNLGVSRGLPCRCPAHLGEGLFRAESPPRSIAYCLPSLPPGTRGAHPFKGSAGWGQGHLAECQCGRVIALWMAFSSVSGLMGPTVSGVRPLGQGP